MNPNIPNDQRQELEARLTALLLGELPPEQEAALRAAMAQDPALAKLHAQLAQTIPLVRETALNPAAQTAESSAPLKLSEQRRQMLLAQFKTVRPKEFVALKRRERSRRALMGLAAVFVGLLALAAFLPTLSRSRAKSQASPPAHLKFGTWSMSEQSRYSKVEPEPQPAGPTARSTPSDSAGLTSRRINVSNVFLPKTELPAQEGKPIIGYLVTSPQNQSVSSSDDEKATPSALAAPPSRFSASKAISDRTSDSSPASRTLESAGRVLVDGDKETLVLGDTPILGREFAAGVAKAKDSTLVPLDLKLPAPGFKGTPKEIRPEQTLKAIAPQSPAVVSSAPTTPPLSAGYMVVTSGAKAGESPVAASPSPILQRFYGGTSPTSPSSGHAVVLPEGGFTADQLQSDFSHKPIPSSTMTGGAAYWHYQAQPPTSVISPELATKTWALEESATSSQPLQPANGLDTAEKPKQNEAESIHGDRARQITSDKLDLAIPQTTMFEIVERASPDSAPPTTLGQKLRGWFTTEVERKARVKAERDQTVITGLAAGGRMDRYDPYFTQTQLETVQSEAVLGKAIKQLKLDEAWAAKGGVSEPNRENTLRLLRQHLEVKAVPKTDLLEIGVKSDDPAEAARIANAVAEAYRDVRREERGNLATAGTPTFGAGTRGLDQSTERFRAQLAGQSDASPPQPTGKRGATNTNTWTDSDALPAKVIAPPPPPQPEIQTRENPVSTFSLNVSDVSFKLAAASLEKDTLPEPPTIRSEEFINAFDYRDPEAPPGVPVAFAWERAQYPFAHNRDLLRFSLKTAAQGRQPGRALNLVLLLDNSGSMERADRVRIQHEALRVLAAQLQPQDKISVVTFARTARLWIDDLPGNQAGQIADEAAKLAPQGGTNLEDALNLAYQTALRHYLTNGINRVVLLTDGAANLGEVQPDALRQKVEIHRRQGIALDCFGIGWEGYNDDLLEVLSRHGDGRYGFINSAEAAATEFAGRLAGALQVAAADVKVQVEFNPGRVTAYRQVGYTKHQLTKEQFRDNTVDAAEIAATEAGNALYVIEVSSHGEGPLATVHIRYRTPGTAEYHEHAWSVPYTGYATPLDQAKPSLRLASTASAFSEWLAGSPYAAEATPDRLLSYFRGVPEAYGADPRPKQLEWMLLQAKRIAGK